MDRTQTVIDLQSSPVSKLLPRDPGQLGRRILYQWCWGGMGWVSGPAVAACVFVFSKGCTDYFSIHSYDELSCWNQGSFDRRLEDLQLKFVSICHLIFHHCKLRVSLYGEKRLFLWGWKPKIMNLNSLSKPQDSCFYHQLAGAYNYNQEDLSRFRNSHSWSEAAQVRRWCCSSSRLDAPSCCGPTNGSGVYESFCDRIEFSPNKSSNIRSPILRTDMKTF